MSGFFEAIGAPMIGDLPFVYVESAQQNGWGWIPASGFKISNNVVKVAGAVGHFIGPIIDALEAMGEYYDDRIIRQSNGYEGSTHSATGATNLGGALADKRLGWSERNLGGQLADDRREGGSSASGHVLDSAGSGVASGAMKGVGSALGQGAASTVAYQDRIQRVANGYEGVNATFSYPYYDDAIIRKANGYEGANVTWSDPAKSSATVTREQVNKVLVNANPYKIGYGNGIGPDSRTSWTDTDGHSHWGSVAEYNRAVERGEVDHGSKSEHQERYNQAQPHGGQHETGGLTNTPGTVSGTNNQTSNDPDTSPVSPVLLDLDGNGVKITEFGNSTQFMTGKDGLQHRSSWAGAGDGVLFYDPDGRNAITEARQYVFTEWAPTAQGDLEAIRQVWDTNGDGKLTAADAEFAKFKVMVTGADGQTSVKTLTELGITEIDLTANATRMELPDGSMITGQTTYQRANGTTGTVANTTLVTDTAGYRVVEVVGTDGVNRVVTQTGYGGMRLAA